MTDAMLYKRGYQNTYPLKTLEQVLNGWKHPVTLAFRYSTWEEAKAAEGHRYPKWFSRGRDDLGPLHDWSDPLYLWTCVAWRVKAPPAERFVSARAWHNVVETARNAWGLNPWVKALPVADGAARNHAQRQPQQKQTRAPAAGPDIFYLWRLKRKYHQGLPVYKVGITSSHLGDQRIHQVAKKAQGRAEVVLKVKLADPRDVEALALSLGTNPHLAVPDGRTEFRAYTDKDVWAIVVACGQRAETVLI